jgi:site-specific DNA recombinase
MDMEAVRGRPTSVPALVAVPDTRTLPNGRRAFGHSADRAQLVEVEAAAIREAASRVLAGETISSVVREWNERGLTTAGGGPWRVNSLSSLLVQPRLTGPPRILDDETHARLLALHASRGKGPRRITRRYLLTGLLRCWRCGGTLRGMPRAGGADLYVCPGPPHGGCSGTAVTADHAEEAISEMVLTHLAATVLTAPVDGRERLLELAGHRQRLLELGDLWAAGQISRDEWISLKRNVGNRALAAEAEVARMSRMSALRDLAGSGRALRARWPAMDIEERRGVVQTALNHVVVLAAEPPRQVFRPERLQPAWLE